MRAARPAKAAPRARAASGAGGGGGEPLTIRQLEAGSDHTGALLTDLPLETVRNVAWP